VTGYFLTCAILISVGRRGKHLKFPSPFCFTNGFPSHYTPIQSRSRKMNLSKQFTISLLCVACCITARAAGPINVASPLVKKPHTWAPPENNRYEGVKNFGEVTDHIWRGDQPTAVGFQKLYDAGVRTIISLRSDHDDFDLLRGTKLKYVRIPMLALDPELGNRAQLVLALKTLRKLSTGPLAQTVYVHCAAGKDRTGFVIAGYLVTFEGWTAEEAIREMRDYHFNRIWVLNEPFLRRLNVVRLRELVDRAP